ncbi:MAG: MFS transporter [Chloroflexota bacterium]
MKRLGHQWGGATGGILAYTHLSHDLVTGLLVALIPLIREALGLNYFQSGLLVSAYTITAGIAHIPMGWIGDHANRRAMAALGLGGVSLAAIAIGLGPGYYPMLAIAVILGVLAGAYHPAAVSLLSGYIEPARRGKALALHMLGGSIGLALGPVLGGLIADNLGWRFAFILLTIPALVAVPLVLGRLGYMDAAGRGQAGGASGSDETTVGQRLMLIGRVLRPVAIIVALVFLMQFIGGSFMAFIGLYLTDKHGVVPSLAVMWVGVVRGGGMAGSLLGGWLSDRWGRRKVIFLVILATGPILYLIARLPYGAVFAVVLVVFGLVSYMKQPAMHALLMDESPPQLRATIFGLYFGFSMEGVSVIQPLAGYFMDKFGIVSVFDVMALVAVGLSLAGLVLVKGFSLRRDGLDRR